eukprot:Gb_08839 [translate_table: standard]
MGVGRHIPNEIFIVGGYQWAIYFYLDGKNAKDNPLYVYVFIALASEGTDVRALFELILVDQSGKGKNKIHSHFNRALKSGPYTLKYQGSMWAMDARRRRRGLFVEASLGRQGTVKSLGTSTRVRRLEKAMEEKRRKEHEKEKDVYILNREEIMIPTNIYCLVCNKKSRELQNDVTYRAEIIVELTQQVRDLQNDARLLKANAEDDEAKLVFLRQIDFSSSSDVVILASEGVRFPAHRSILASKSEVFRAMFSSEMKERESEEIVIEDATCESIGAFLSFLYTAEIGEETLGSNIEDVVRLSHRYNVDFLLSTCDEFIVNSLLSEQTVVGFLRMAYVYNLKATKKACLELVKGCPGKFKQFAAEVQELNSEALMKEIYHDVVHDVFDLYYHMDRQCDVKII